MAIKLHIIGEGSFGTFISEVLASKFELTQTNPDVVILAVPISAYSAMGAEWSDRHLINVCSIQELSSKYLLEWTDKVTGLHPLFGRRTPSDERDAVITRLTGSNLEKDFLEKFSQATGLRRMSYMTAEEHDRNAAKTHKKALLAAKLLKPIIDDAKDIPEYLVPNSFRLMRKFVQTMEDMPQGTVESIMANPYE